MGKLRLPWLPAGGARETEDGFSDRARLGSRNTDDAETAAAKRRGYGDDGIGERQILAMGAAGTRTIATGTIAARAVPTGAASAAPMRRRGARQFGQAGHASGVDHHLAGRAAPNTFAAN